MTIDEAIAQLENLRKCEIYLWSKDIQAIDIAIKALEENDTLKTEIMALKGGSDVLKICKLEEENAELKRLLKLAVEDIKTLLCSVGAPIYSREGRESCKVCCFNHKCDCSNYCSVRTAYKKWKHAEEALEVLGDEK